MPLRKLCSPRSKCKISNISKIKNCFPILDWLPKYKLSFLPNDLIAGFALGLMIIPQSLGHAVIAGLPPQYGLYSSFPAMLVYLFFGTSKDASIGTTVLTALLANRYSVTENPNPNIVAALTFIVGIVLVAVAICRLGFIVRFLSYPVISGMLSALCIIIIIGQLRYLFGLGRAKRQMFSKAKYFVENVKNTRLGDITMAMVCLMLLFFLDYVSRRKIRNNEAVPRWRLFLRKVIRVIAVGRNALVVILAILVSYTFSVYGKGDIFWTVGIVPDGLPKPEFPLKTVRISSNETISVGEIVSGFGSATGIVPLIIIFLSLAIAKTFGRINGYKVDVFQEILSLGLSNIFGSFFKAIPMIGSFARASVCSSSRSKTPLTGAISSFLVIFAIQFLGPLFRFAPMSSLSAIVVASVVKLFDYQLAMKLWKLNKFDFLCWIVTFITCLYEIEIGMFSGILVSSCAVLFREFNPRLKMTVGKENRKLVVEVRGGVWFPGIESVVSRISRKLNKERELIDVVVLDCQDMLEIDYTVIHGFQDLKTECLLNNVKLKFENVHSSKMKKMLEGSDLIKSETSATNPDKSLDVLEMDRCDNT